MNRKLVQTLFLMVLMAMITLSASVARADVLNIVFNPASVSGYPGTTVSFSGTITATAATDLAGDSISLAGPFSATNIDDSPFLLNAPLSMIAGDTWSGVLFNLTLPLSTPQFTAYPGFFSVLDGSGNVVGTGQFAVTAVPEPASMLLLGSGLSGLVGVIRRKRQS